MDKLEKEINLYGENITFDRLAQRVYVRFKYTLNDAYRVKVMDCLDECVKKCMALANQYNEDPYEVLSFAAFQFEIMSQIDAFAYEDHHEEEVQARRSQFKVTE